MNVSDYQATASVNVSLPKLAEHDRTSGTYNDGWGVGYYEGVGVRKPSRTANLSASRRAQDACPVPRIVQINRRTYSDKAFGSIGGFDADSPLTGIDGNLGHHGAPPSIPGGSRNA
jgi:hypothetical protein